MVHALDHHAYVVIGPAGDALPKLFSVLEKRMNFRVKGNPDFLLEQYEVMGIHEAQALQVSAQQKAVSGDAKVIVISARGMTKEAQNALLKVFEEPPAGTRFFLVVPLLEILLPTLRSRLFVLTLDADRRDTHFEAVAEFLSASVPARLALVQKILKELERGKKKNDDSSVPLPEKEWIMGFLDTLEQTLADKDRRLFAPALREVLLVRKYSRDRAPSFKLLLEHLALVLPQVE